MKKCIDNNSLLDKIIIKELLVSCIIGINPDERKCKQDIVINITMYVDLSLACSSDCIDDTVNYEDIKNKIIFVLENSSYFLIERLAERIADVCLEIKMIKRVRICVEKREAVKFTQSVGVEIVREQK